MSLPEIINILRVDPAGAYCLTLHFDDGSQQCIDFGPFLVRAIHPAIRAFLDPLRFADWHLEHGELVWGDYDLCFPIADLYHNRILSGHALETAA